MWVFFLEAGVALCLLLFIVWWTMFAGKTGPGDETDDRNAPDRREEDR
ncbi:MAG: hypothetical protein ACTHKB_08595 [Burkholderiaceae bacterium]